MSNIKKLLERFERSRPIAEMLENLLFEEFSKSAINQLQQKYGEDSLPLIQKFDAFRSTNRKEVKGIDIFNFKDKDSLEKFINSVPESKSKKERISKDSGSEMVYENDEVFVFLIKNKNACISYGSNTKWCITSAEQKYWENYTSKGITFYFIIRKNSKGDSFDKIAIAKYPESLDGLIEAYDAKDNSIQPKKVFNTFNLNQKIFKEWDDPNFKYITVGKNKIKYKEEDGIRIFGSINISNQNLTKLPDFENV